MVSVYTPNIQLEEPARGDQVGTWDTPMNANATLIDLVVGGTATIPLAGAPVVLAAAQFQAKTIVFNSTLTANVAITFPTSFTKSYEIFNQTTGSSNFVITLQSTAAGATAICCPPGEIIDVANIAGSMYFKNLGRVGQYWDHGGSSVPHWVSACTVPPYLNCDGTAFSSATYPNLRNFLGVATLPDARSRFRATLNQGRVPSRITVAGCGVDGDVLLAGGGDELMQLHTHAVTDPGHTHGVSGGTRAGTADAGLTAGGLGGVISISSIVINSAVTGITNANTGTGVSQNMPPFYISGITMIRSG